MLLPADSTIAPEKLTKYLLVLLPKDDKCIGGNDRSLSITNHFPSAMAELYNRSKFS